jgi:hypothetical protein
MGCSSCKQKNNLGIDLEIPEGSEGRLNIITRIFTCLCVIILSPVILIFINYVAISNVLIGNAFDMRKLPIISNIINRKRNNNFNEVDNKYVVEEDELVE